MAKAAKVDPEQQLVDDVVGYSLDPLGFTEYAYPWEKLESKPRDWQRRVLMDIRDHLNSPLRFTPLMVAVSSGHGIGKSAECAFIINWGMSTCEDCKVLITANTLDQLRTKTWPEMAKWNRMAINAHWFELGATSLTVKSKGHEKLWRCDMTPWSEENTEAFQGLHNQGKRIIVIFDEASAIADKVWEVAEGAMTDANTEIIWLAFGNPTRNTGRFRECFGRYKHRWKVYHVDSRTVEGTNKEQIGKWVEDYGEDSDFVRVRVRGEFPRAGSNQFIGTDVVASCRRFESPKCTDFPKYLGVDVARFGDDQTVLVLRQGRKCWTLGKYRGKDTAEVTAQVISFIEEHEPDAVVVDSDGIGATVFDQLKFQGYSRRLFEFHGGKPANDAKAYFNRRSEVWGAMRDWLTAGAEIPNDPELETDLTGPQYGFSSQQQIQLEKKDDMKKRGLSSPDTGDALAMTFAVRVSAPRKQPKLQYSYPSEMGQKWMQ